MEFVGSPLNDYYKLFYKYELRYACENGETAVIRMRGLPDIDQETIETRKMIADSIDIFIDDTLVESFKGSCRLVIPDACDPIMFRVSALSKGKEAKRPYMAHKSNGENLAKELGIISLNTDGFIGGLGLVINDSKKCAVIDIKNKRYLTDVNRGVSNVKSIFFGEYYYMLIEYDDNDVDNKAIRFKWSYGEKLLHSTSNYSLYNAALECGFRSINLEMIDDTSFEDESDILNKYKIAGKFFISTILCGAKEPHVFTDSIKLDSNTRVHTIKLVEYKDNKLIYHWGCPGTQGYVSFSRRPEYLLFLNEDDTVDMLNIRGNKLASFEKSIQVVYNLKICGEDYTLISKFVPDIRFTCFTADEYPVTDNENFRFYREQAMKTHSLIKGKALDVLKSGKHNRPDANIFGDDTEYIIFIKNKHNEVDRAVVGYVDNDRVLNKIKEFKFSKDKIETRVFRGPFDDKMLNSIKNSLNIGDCILNTAEDESICEELTTFYKHRYNPTNFAGSPCYSMITRETPRDDLIISEKQKDILDNNKLCSRAKFRRLYKSSGDENKA